MASDAQRLDGVVGGLLTRTIDSVTQSLADEARIDELVARFGLTGEAAVTAANALKGSQGDITAITSAIASAVTELESGHPDAVKLIGPVAQAWKGISDLIDTLETVTLPQPPAAPGAADAAELARIGGVAVLTDVGAFLQTLLAGALDDAIRALTPSVWAFLRGVGLSAPDLPIVDLVQSVIDDPTAFLWERAKTLRRTIDISLDGILTCVRTSSIVTLPVVDEP
jgi:hypothetical protein